MLASFPLSHLSCLILHVPSVRRALPCPALQSVTRSPFSIALRSVGVARGRAIRLSAAIRRGRFHSRFCLAGAARKATAACNTSTPQRILFFNLQYATPPSLESHESLKLKSITLQETLSPSCSSGYSFFARALPWRRRRRRRRRATSRPSGCPVAVGCLAARSSL